MDHEFRNDILAYFDDAVPVLMFIFSAEGTILSANRFAIEFTGRPLVGENFGDVIVDFKGSFDLSAVESASSKERLVTISHPSTGLPQSFYFKFKRDGGRVLALGRLDAAEIENMRREMISLNQELGNLNRALHQKNAQLKRTNAELSAALTEIKTLSGLLPLCSFCKKIRDDTGYWNQIDLYIRDHTDADISHSLCPECAAEHYPGMHLYDR